jgi:hypothetical protein
MHSSVDKRLKIKSSHSFFIMAGAALVLWNFTLDQIRITSAFNMLFSRPMTGFTAYI